MVLTRSWSRPKSWQLSWVSRKNQKFTFNSKYLLIETFVETIKTKKKRTKNLNQDSSNHCKVITCIHCENTMLRVFFIGQKREARIYCEDRKILQCLPSCRLMKISSTFFRLTLIRLALTIFNEKKKLLCFQVRLTVQQRMQRNKLTDLIRTLTLNDLIKKTFWRWKKKRNKVEATKIQTIDRETNGHRREVKQWMEIARTNRIE